MDISDWFSSLTWVDLLRAGFSVLVAIPLTAVTLGPWFLLFGGSSSSEKQAKNPPLSWNIVVVDPARSYTEYTVVPSGTEVAKLSQVGRAYVLEGPFYDLDKAIARRDELAKKRP